MAAINGFSVGVRDAVGVGTFRVPGTDVRLPGRREVAPLLIGLARDFHNTVEELRGDECWGYALRNVRGGSTPSFQAAGIAIDLNATRHPLGKRNTFDPDQMQRCRGLALKYGCRWGGDDKRRADEMHFEVIVPRGDALKLVGGLQSGGIHPPYPGRAMRLGPTRDVHVRTWQARMQQRRWKIPVTGDFCERTDRVVRRLQEEKELEVDGVVGRRTWAAAWTAPVT